MTLPREERVGYTNILTKSNNGVTGWTQNLMSPYKENIVSFYIVTIGMVLRKNHAQQNYCWGSLADPLPLATWPPKDIGNIVFGFISATTKALRLKWTSNYCPPFPSNTLPDWFIDITFYFTDQKKLWISFMEICGRTIIEKQNKT